MLVIFFLQSENVLPPIRNLQKDISEDDKIEINGWHFGYSLQVIKKSKDQTETIFGNVWKWREWLCRFYSFYLKFDYETFVISPYAGKGISRKHFEAIALSIKDVKGHTVEIPGEVHQPDENIITDFNLSTYYENVKHGNHTLLSLSSSLCVQDPFEQNFCVSRGFSKVGIMHWRNNCLVAMEYLQGCDSSIRNGIVGILEKLVPAPKSRHDQREIVTKIGKVTGIEIPVNAGKRRNKTRTGKAKNSDNSTAVEKK